MYVGDWVLQEIEREIARHPPERGGALLGPPRRLVVTRFLSDHEGEGAPAAWRPSRALDLAVKEAERDEGLELKGLVHSHPRVLDAPSAQDRRELGVGLERNPHMALYLAPIVTRGGAVAAAPHELPLGDAKIGFYAAQRTRGGEPTVLALPVREIPLLRDLETVAADLGAERPEVFLSRMASGPVLAGRLRAAGGLELLVLATEHHPELPPVLLVTTGGATEQLEVPWPLAAPPEERLRRAVASVFRPPGPYRRAFGPRGGRALTRDPGCAELAGFEARFTGEDVDAAAESVRDGLLARGKGLLSRELRGRSVLVVGCGSVGSYVAEQLARSGVGRLTLLDPERVEDANLSRTSYEAADVGRSKVEALARRLLRIDPALELTLDRDEVQARTPDALDAIVRPVDLVVAGTDDPAAQRAIDRFAYARGKPALFVGLYAGAEGGEVILTVPGRTPCYGCATRVRHEVERAAGRVGREVDYGSARLRGEPALGADVQHVASAAVKLALALLVPGDQGSSLKAFVEGPLADGTSYLTLSMVPRYWFYPSLFGEVPGQGAYQSVWLAPTRGEACAVCGPPAERVDPLEVPLRAPRAEAFAAARGTR